MEETHSGQRPLGKEGKRNVLRKQGKTSFAAIKSPCRITAEVHAGEGFRGERLEAFNVGIRAADFVLFTVGSCWRPT